MNAGSNWNEDRIETLKRLHMAGLSCSQIARQLGGVTRNAVIGKIHRMGLDRPARPSPPPAGRALGKAQASRPIRPASTPRTFPSAAAPPPKKVAPAPTAPPAKSVDELAVLNAQLLASGKSLVDLEPHMCKWPLNAPPAGRMDETKFCGRAKAEPAEPYCRDHARASSTPSTAKKPASASELARALRRFA